MINMIVVHKSLRFIAILFEHPWNDSVWRRHFWQRKTFHIVAERFQFCYCWSNDHENAWSYNQNRRLNTLEVSTNFQWGFSHKQGNYVGYIINNDVKFGTAPHVGI